MIAKMSANKDTGLAIHGSRNPIIDLLVRISAQAGRDKGADLRRTPGRASRGMI